MKKEEILYVLKAQQDYVSGQELCERFGVSRTAVWKAIKLLEKEGYQIEAVNNKGYRLLEQADMMSQWEIAAQLQTKWVGRNLVYVAETGSTNQDAGEQAIAGAESGTLVVAKKQTAGRGRRGRTWENDENTAIAMSLLLRPTCRPDEASALTLVTALSVRDAVAELIPQECLIKWPNDIVVNRKKICGILTEMSIDMDAIHYVIIGIGINVNQQTIPQEIAGIATSLYQESGLVINRSKLIARVMYYFEQYYETFSRTNDLSQLKAAYDAHLANYEKEVCVLDPKGEYRGIAKGINEKGELLVEKEEGGLTQVYAGEVSVRGIYGYI